MKIEVNEVYRMHEETDIAQFVLVSGIKADMVIGSPLSGGWQLNIPISDFKEKFVHVSKADLALLKSNFKEKHFDLDDWEETIPAWSNGEIWNGWGCPNFERKVLEKAIENGILCDDYTKVFVRDEGAYAIISMSNELPKDYDWSEIVDRLHNGEEIYEEEIAPGISIEGNFFAKQIITVDGRDIETYPVGAYSWCWNQHDEPQVYNQPTP